MRIILTKEENEARLRKPKGAVMVWIDGSDGIACVFEYADLSGNGAHENVELKIPVEVEAITEQASGFVLKPTRTIIVRD